MVWMHVALVFMYNRLGFDYFVVPNFWFRGVWVDVERTGYFLDFGEAFLAHDTNFVSIYFTT